MPSHSHGRFFYGEGFCDGPGYHPLAFLVAYLTLLGLPFIWVLPHTGMGQFKILNGVFIGLGTVILLGIFHVIHYISDGDPDSFLIVIPLAGVCETIVICSLFV